MGAFRFESWQQQYIHCRSRHEGKPITCWYMRRVRGTIAERVDVVLSPEACRQFQIWAPMSLGKEKAARIEAWSAKNHDLRT